jgi:pimeloyl-ACP methyl ester carboxylesterase
VHFTDTGTSDVPLVLFHAFPVDSRMWAAVRAPIAEHIRVITFDQPGFGRTPAVDHEPSLDFVAAEALAQLDGLGVERAIFGGCSMGGYVAMAVVRAARDRVAGLLLANTKAVADVAEQRAGRATVAGRAEREGTGWLCEAMLPVLLGETTRTSRAEVVATAQELITSQSGAGVAWAARAMAGRPDSTADLRGLDVPALVVAGSEDRLMPPSLVSELAALLPGAQLAVLGGVGHLPPLEDPALFTTAVTGWLKSW